MYRAFELLHRLGTALLPVEGAHRTVDGWAVRGEGVVIILCTNWAMPRHPIDTEEVRITLDHLPKPAAATIERIDTTHVNVTHAWKTLGEPQYPSARQMRLLHAASELTPRIQRFRYREGALSIGVTLPPQSVTAITVQCPADTPLLRI